MLADGTEPPGWAAFVSAFVAAAGSGQAGSGGVGFVSGDAQVVQADASGIKIAGTLTDGARANVTRSETYVFTRLGDQDGLALILPAYLDAGGAGQVQGVWDYSLTTLSDGTEVDPGHGPVPGAVRRAARDLPGAVHLAVRERQRHRGAAAAQQPGGDREREHGRHHHRVERGGAAGDRRPADAVRLPGELERLRRGRCPRSRSRSATRSRSPSTGCRPTTPFEMAVIVGDAAGNTDAAGTSARVP